MSQNICIFSKSADSLFIPVHNHIVVKRLPQFTFSHVCQLPITVVWSVEGEMLFSLLEELGFFADLKAGAFTAEGKCSVVSDLEQKYRCVIEIRTRG